MLSCAGVCSTSLSDESLVSSFHGISCPSRDATIGRGCTRLGSAVGLVCDASGTSLSMQPAVTEESLVL